MLVPLSLVAGLNTVQELKYLDPARLVKGHQERHQEKHLRDKKHATGSMKCRS